LPNFLALHKGPQGLFWSFSCRLLLSESRPRNNRKVKGLPPATLLRPFHPSKWRLAVDFKIAIGSLQPNVSPAQDFPRALYFHELRQ
jgi:hypothetical protein